MVSRLMDLCHYMLWIDFKKIIFLTSLFPEPPAGPGQCHHQQWTPWGLHPYWSCWYRQEAGCWRVTPPQSQPGNKCTIFFLPPRNCWCLIMWLDDFNASFRTCKVWCMFSFFPGLHMTFITVRSAYKSGSQAERSKQKIWSEAKLRSSVWLHLAEHFNPSY